MPLLPPALSIRLQREHRGRWDAALVELAALEPDVDAGPESQGPGADGDG